MTAPWDAEPEPDFTGPEPVWDADGEHIVGHEGDRHLTAEPGYEPEAG
jgi:hypothetical protein